MTDILALDTTDPAALNGLNPPAVFGYGEGYWPTYLPLCAMFPHAFHGNYAIAARYDGDFLDIENGDASPAEAPGWVRRQWARGIARPGLYANMSTMPAVVAALAADGIPLSRVRTIQAHYTYVAHRCTPQTCFLNGVPSSVTADATQWTDRYAGRNIDGNNCAPDFFATTAAPLPVPKRSTLLEDPMPPIAVPTDGPRGLCLTLEPANFGHYSEVWVSLGTSGNSTPYTIWAHQVGHGLLNSAEKNPGYWYPLDHGPAGTNDPKPFSRTDGRRAYQMPNGVDLLDVVRADPTENNRFSVLVEAFPAKP